MRYLILPTDGEPFMTDWFTTENMFLPGMIVFDLSRGLYTKDGFDWRNIPEDHL